MNNVLGKKVIFSGIEGIVVFEYETQACDYKIIESDGLYYIIASSLLDWSDKGWTQNWRLNEDSFDNLDEALEYCCGFIPDRFNYANLRFAEHLL